MLQFIVSEPISVVASHCKYENDHSFGAHIAINCEGLSLSLGVCDNLKKDVKLSSVAAVLFESCEIGEFSQIFNQFPNIKKLVFLENNTLPSANLPQSSNLSLFINIDSKFKAMPSSSLSINATNLEWFQFKGNQINAISLVNPQKLEFFSLEKTTMSKLPSDLFQNSSNLKAVSASYNQLSRIDSIKWPNSLKWINFKMNKITQLTKRSFENLSNLQILDLGTNEISKIEAETFSKLNNLTLLGIHENNIDKIAKKTLKGLSALQTIDLHDNKIKFIEDGAFEATPKLRLLELSGNKISTFNQHTFTGPNLLKILKLDRNPIHEITNETFANLTQLWTLTMSQCQLETIDFNAFANSLQLKELDLSKNKIVRLVKMVPRSVVPKNRKTEIVCSAVLDYDEWLTPIIAKGEKFLNKETKAVMTELVKFAVNRRQDVTAKPFFCSAENVENHKLKSLSLSQNQLTVIDKAIFAEFKNLENLFLFKNPISTLYPESFAGLDKLKNLFMQNCELTAIHFETIAHLTKLQILNLSHNRLITITAAPMPSMTILNLNDNQLTAFPMKKTDLPKISTLIVDNNNNLTCSTLNDFTNIDLFCGPN